MKRIASICVLLMVGFALGVSYERWNDHFHFGRKGRGMIGRPPPGGPRGADPHFLEQLSFRLELSEQQQDEIEEVLKSQHQKLESLRESTLPRFEAIQTETAEAIRALLDERQTIIFNALSKDPPRRPPHHGPPHGPPDGPPRGGPPPGFSGFGGPPPPPPPRRH